MHFIVCTIMHLSTLLLCPLKTVLVEQNIKKIICRFYNYILLTAYFNLTLYVYLIMGTIL